MVCERYFAVLFAKVTDTYVCRLEERFDHRSGEVRWSLPRKEICHCQAVVAPRRAGSRSCSGVDNTEIDKDLWFTDDPTPLVDRRNWDKTKLDQYLNRHYCCTFGLLFPYFTFNIHVNTFILVIDNDCGDD